MIMKHIIFEIQLIQKHEPNRIIFEWMTNYINLHCQDKILFKLEKVQIIVQMVLTLNCINTRYN